MATKVRTQILVLSDTHGLRFPIDPKLQKPVDVAIHCGDLTESSSVEEYKATLQLLRDISAPLKIVIAGNHDLHLDPPALNRNIDEAERVNHETFDRRMVNEEIRTGKSLFDTARAEEIVFLEEGTYQFVLRNGAALKLFASPFTPSTEGWAFEYATHDFDIQKGTDIVVTHGPPLGLLDISSTGKRIGCPQLFKALARSQPKMHCFGHVHHAWGARLVSWRPQLSENPSHFQDIDNSKSFSLENLARRNDPTDIAEARRERFKRYRDQGFCPISHSGDYEGSRRTLFVNAATKGDNGLTQVPWLVEMDLYPATDSDE
ncbi:putative rhamnogalacturonate lyase C [Colletotrichum trifolii]|uniref:Putative rhamnogalacturonate lyase C n=1 Tax=Colletotrichum trifolii TaxID=5466 RepID=A0A4R8RQW0_COLTR|nr:putative rhamnogalacturonate lyase C [Colletotrichum trifolii]